MKKLLILMGVLSACFCHGASEPESNRWEVNGSAKKVFDSPLGGVYRIEESEVSFVYPPTLKYSRSEYPKMGSLFQVAFPKNLKFNKRYVVMDFTIRGFPAYSSKASPAFSFSVIRSEQPKIMGYQDLNGMLEFISTIGAFHYTSYYQPKYPSYIMNNMAKFIHFDFEPLSIRVTFDTRTEEVITIINGIREIQTDREHESSWTLREGEWLCHGTIVDNDMLRNTTPAKVRSLGIIVKHDKDQYRNQYLEITQPVIRQFDSLKEADEVLKPVVFRPYPYANYYTGEKKRNDNRDKNPDYQYAMALRALYGAQNECNPAEAIKLLGKAADEDHIPALYQLGVCYFRGYGVEPDIKRAQRYLWKARDQEYQDAIALDWFVDWESRGRPKFTNSKLIKSFEMEVKGNIHYAHDFGLSALLICGSSTPTQAISLKYAAFQDNVIFCISRDSPNKPAYFVDYAIAAGYYPACAAKAMYGRKPATVKGKARSLLDDSERLALFAQGIETGDESAVPEWLELLAKKGKLPEKEFTPLRNLRFADNALYQFLAMLMKYPDMPGVSEYLRGNPAKAMKQFEEGKDARSSLFLGLRRLSGLEPGRMTLTTLEQNIPRAEEAFTHLQKAAAQGEPVAQYLLARYYFRQDLPSQVKFASQIDVRKLLNSAAASGHMGALLLLAEVEFDNNPVQAEKYLEQPCAIGYAPAFYLKGKLLQKFSWRAQEAEKAFAKAAELGDYRGWQTLALHFAGRQAPAAKQKLWFDYIQADRNYRKFDICDPFYPDAYKELGKWKRSGGYPEMNLQQEGLKRQEEYQDFQRKVRAAQPTRGK